MILLLSWALSTHWLPCNSNPDWYPDRASVILLKCLHRAQRILKDNVHPATVCSPYGRTTRLSFCPHTVRPLNSSSTLHYKYSFTCVWYCVGCTTYILLYNPMLYHDFFFFFYLELLKLHVQCIHKRPETV